MTGNMELIATGCFRPAVWHTHRFDVQKLATEVLKEMRIHKKASTFSS